MRTAQELTTAIPATVRDLENWLGRFELQTEYHAPARGQARMYSKMNAYELGIIAALVKGGVSASRAVGFSKSFVLDAKHGMLNKRRRWLAFPAIEVKNFVATNHLDPDALVKRFDSVAFSVVDIHGLVARIEKLFEEA